MKFSKRFAGSYFAVLSNGNEVTIQSYAQFTGESETDCNGNKWIATFENDFEGDLQLRAKSKAELIEKIKAMV
jgi:hypothetical protein